MRGSQYKNGVVWDQGRLSKLTILWQKAHSIDEVCEKMGMMYSQLMPQASRLRARGVPLKRFKNRPIDYQALMRLAIKHNEENTVH